MRRFRRSWLVAWVQSPAAILSSAFLISSAGAGFAAQTVPRRLDAWRPVSRDSLTRVLGRARLGPQADLSAHEVKAAVEIYASDLGRRVLEAQASPSPLAAHGELREELSDLPTLERIAPQIAAVVQLEAERLASEAQEVLVESIERTAEDWGGQVRDFSIPERREFFRRLMAPSGAELDRPRFASQRTATQAHTVLGRLGTDDRTRRGVEQRSFFEEAREWLNFPRRTLLKGAAGQMVRHLLPEAISPQGVVQSFIPKVGSLNPVEVLQHDSRVSSWASLRFGKDDYPPERYLRELYGQSPKINISNTDGQARSNLRRYYRLLSEQPGHLSIIINNKLTGERIAVEGEILDLAANRWLMFNQEDPISGKSGAYLMDIASRNHSPVRISDHRMQEGRHWFTPDQKWLFICREIGGNEQVEFYRLSDLTKVGTHFSSGCRSYGSSGQFFKL